MSPFVRLRDMRQDEYDAYSEQQLREYVESQTGLASTEAALRKAHRDRERFLPHGLATERHRLLVAENDSGEMVGTVWLGLDSPGSKDESDGRSAEMAWLYDIRVDTAYRRSGYGAAILSAVEVLARDAGALRLGLNVFGHNTPALALYERSGYEVTTQQMAKRLR
ncbi:GNAT family N-acetyltransferase [Salinispora arenicola]|uniref:GNAT family N-acetyltransferase n=1 Tax=Salinispora arenicola TaxID=168697 RepID=UPI0020796929|nr:GNAT family N-acetyltransferase [Salinispora arenicola]MCN0181028.1 GNAT family N-acetyltransferase [Salinispora arenicola]